MLKSGETLPWSPAGRRKVRNLTEETRRAGCVMVKVSEQRVTGQGVMESGHRAAEKKQD